MRQKISFLSFADCMIARHTSNVAIPHGPLWRIGLSRTTALYSFFEFSTPGRTAAANQWNVFGSLVAVNVKSQLRLANIAAFTGRDEDS